MSSISSSLFDQEHLPLNSKIDTMAINKQIIVGNLGKEPEARQSEQGFLACRFTVAATDKAYTTQSGVQVPEHTEWFNIYCKNRLAEVARDYLHKGDKVYIEGKTVTREYFDNQGVKRTFVEVQCDVLEMLSSKNQNASNQYQQNGYQQQAPQYQPQQMQYNQPAQPTGVFGQPANVPGTDPNKPW